MALDHGDDFNYVPFLIANSEVVGIDTLCLDSKNEYKTFCKRKMPNKPRALQSSKTQFDRFYFKDDIVYNEAAFERRFRLLRRLFHIIKMELLGEGCFIRKKDAIGRLEIHLRIRIIAALRVLTYRIGYDAGDKLAEMLKGCEKLIYRVHRPCSIRVLFFILILPIVRFYFCSKCSQTAS